MPFFRFPSHLDDNKHVTFILSFLTPLNKELTSNWLLAHLQNKGLTSG
jgi:hypothetical protein